MNISVKYDLKSQIALIVVGVILNLALMSYARADTEITTPHLASIDVIESDDIVFGHRDAAVKVIEYFSPTCFPCSLFHQKIFPALKERYIDTNKITYVIREFINNKQDLDASILARCTVTNGGSYLKMIEAILFEQGRWAMNKDYRQELTNIGISSGVLAEEYNKCLADDELVTTLMRNAKLAVNTPNFVGTPSIFVNGKLVVQGLSKEEVFEAIDSELLSEGAAN